MTKTLTACALILSVAALATAQAKKSAPPPPGIPWQGDWEAAVKEATARNVPIIFTMHKDLCPRCKAMEEETFRNAKVIELSKSFVNVVAHRETDHGSTETVVGREKVKLCNDYSGIPCETHVKGWSAAGRFITGSFGTPTTVFCDPSGKELFRHEGDPGSADMIKKMTEALSKVDGEKIPLAAWSQATQFRTDAEAAFEKGDFRKSAEFWNKVGKIRGAAFKSTSQDGLRKVDEKGAEALTAALAIPGAEEKKAALRKIVDDFKGLSASTDAKKELDALK